MRVRSDQLVTLDQLERAIQGNPRRTPSDATVIRATSRALRLASSGSGGEFATVLCTVEEGRLRIKSGGDAIEVALELRDRADRRGDHVWAGVLGYRLQFRIVTHAETQTSRSLRTRIWSSFRRRLAPARVNAMA